MPRIIQEDWNNLPCFVPMSNLCIHMLVVFFLACIYVPPCSSSLILPVPRVLQVPLVLVPRILESDILAPCTRTSSLHIYHCNRILVSCSDQGSDILFLAPCIDISVCMMVP